MKRKLVYLLFVLLLLVSMIAISGCGDASKLAGSASIVAEESDDDVLLTQPEENVIVGELGGF